MLVEHGNSTSPGLVARYEWVPVCLRINKIQRYGAGVQYSDRAEWENRPVGAGETHKTCPVHLFLPFS